ncbi:MAG: epoxyqueuosine reductase QueH [Candidatus Helarchaeota archaeon]
MSKLLLHVCCGPCATYSIMELQDESYKVTFFFSNSNIHPKEEYEHRLDSLKNFAQKVKIPLIIDSYNPKEWFRRVKGYEHCAEGGDRCHICIESRLEKTAKYASTHGFDCFTTTLTISPHKNARLINDLGGKIAANYNISFVPKNFKKRNGFKKSVLLSKAHNLYRQNYCGCLFSMRKNTFI